MLIDDSTQLIYISIEYSSSIFPAGSPRSSQKAAISSFFISAIRTLPISSNIRGIYIFHFLYSPVQKSEAPDAGPLNCLTDMISNFGAEIVMIALIIWGGNAATDILAAFFGIGESTVHTVFGIIMHKKLKSKGSKTIYGPGLFTAVFTMLPLSVYAIIRLTQIQLSASDVITGIILVFVIIAGLIRIPVKTLGKYQKQYVFTDSGYYEKYKK